MNIQQGSYLVQESFRTMARHKGVMFLSIVIMSLTLLVLAVFLLATDNVLLLLNDAKQELKIYAYLEEDIPSQTVQQYHTQLLSMNEVQSIIYVSKAEALEEFKKDVGEAEFMLEPLDANPLPASFRIVLKPEHRDQPTIEGFVTNVGALPGIEEVAYGREFVEQFSLITKGFFYVDVVLGLIVLLSSVFVISYTVRLTILSRRESINILKLVGATNRFITTPFIIEGAFQTGLAALVSLSLLLAVYLLVEGSIPGLVFLGLDKMLTYVVICVLLGSLGSYVSLRRFLRL